MHDEEMVKLRAYPYLSPCFSRILKGGGDGEAERMLTGAPPDQQAASFNIHDMTSSPGLGRVDRGRTETRLHAAGSSHWRIPALPNQDWTQQLASQRSPVIQTFELTLSGWMS